MNSQNPAASPTTSHHGTVVPDRTSGPPCNAVRDTARSGHALEPLEGVNPLVVPLERQREWYHYHRLSRDLLREDPRLGRRRGKAASVPPAKEFADT